MNTAYGKLYIDRTIGDEWGYLLVNEDIRYKCFKEMGLEGMGYEIPEYKAHISVFTNEQVKQLPQHIWTQDKWCAYTPTHIQVVNPQDWEQVNSCVILCISCEPLEHLRQSLGFTPLMYGKHKFHITIGIRAQDIDKETQEMIEKMNKDLREQRINKIAKKLVAGNNDEVRTWYKEAYPTDRMVNDIKRGITFKDVYNALVKGEDFYDFVGAGDSIVRERIFMELEQRNFGSYRKIYNLWMNSGKQEQGKPQVGDIWVECASWDYDRTYTFYKVLKVSGKRITFGELDKKGKGYYNSYDYKVTPTNRLTGKQIVKNWTGGDYIKNGRNSLTPYKGGEYTEQHMN